MKRQERALGEAMVDDGRNIDPGLGILVGEASGMEVRRPEDAYPTRKRALPIVPSQAGPSKAEPTYYDLPVLKEPTWIWSIPAYFYVGGVTGISSVLAAVARASGDETLDPLVRVGRWTSAVGSLLSAGLLICDLGRPARFLNMLRVFRPTSPMSVGSWVLVGSGACNTLAALAPRRGGVLSALGDVAGYAGGLLGLPLAGYTAVLIANTAVPIWKGGRRTLPLLFLSSAVASSSSFLLLLDVGSHARPRAVLHRLRTMGKVAELMASLFYEREVSAVPLVGRPLRRGVSGALFRAASMCTAASLGLSLACKGRSGWARRAEGALGTLGALALRFAVFYAGKASAREPRATFRQQRAGMGAAELTKPEARAARAPAPAVAAPTLIRG